MLTTVDSMWNVLDITGYASRALGWYRDGVSCRTCVVPAVPGLAVSPSVIVDEHEETTGCSSPDWQLTTSATLYIWVCRQVR